VSKENKSTIPIKNIDIPPLWSLSRLIDIVSSEKNSIKRGPFGSTIKKSFFVPKGYKIYEQKNAIYSDSTLGNYYIDKKKFEDLLDFQVNPGDFIISCSGTIGKISQLPANAELGIINQALLKIKIDERVILPKYFLYLFRSVEFQKIILKDARGSAMKNIASVKDLKTTPILLPPITDQKRIVAEIEKQFSRLDEAVENLKRVKANLKRYKASVLKAAVEGKLTEEWRKSNPDVEPADKLLERILAERRKKWEEAELAKMKAKGKMPKDDKWKKKYKEPAKPNLDDLPSLLDGWCWAIWDQISNWVTYGFTRPMPHVEKGMPIVTAKHVLNGKIELHNTHKTPIKSYNALSEKDRPNQNDILITKDGTIGRAAIVPKHDGFCINQSVAVIWLRSCPINRRYLLALIESDMTQKPIHEKARGVAIQHLSITDFNKMPLPVPPIKEQHQIVEVTDQKKRKLKELLNMQPIFVNQYLKKHFLANSSDRIILINLHQNY